MSCTQIFRIYQYAILIGILLPFIMRYSYIQADSCIFIWHQRQGIIYDNDTTLHTCIGRYRPFCITHDIGVDMNHIVTSRSRTFNLVIYTYIIVSDDDILGNFFSFIITCISGSISPYILRYIDIEISIFIGLAYLRLILISLHPYRSTNTSALLIRYLTIYTNHVRQDNVHLVFYTRRDSRYFRSRVLTAATIVM